MLKFILIDFNRLHVIYMVGSCRCECLQLRKICEITWVYGGHKSYGGKSLFCNYCDYK